MNYETLSFLEKNRDTLKLDVSQLLRTSENVIVQSLFETPLSRTGGLSPAPTVNKVPPSATPLFSRRGPPMVIEGICMHNNVFLLCDLRLLNLGQ